MLLNYELALFRQALRVQQVYHLIDEDQKYRLWEDPEVRKLAIVRKRVPPELEKKYRHHRREEFDKWIMRNIHAEPLKDTSVIRVWFTDGTPEEQAVIINAHLRAMLKEMETAEKRWTKQKQELAKRFQEEEGFKQKLEKVEKDYEFNVIFPTILEWAAVKGSDFLNVVERLNIEK